MLSDNYIDIRVALKQIKNKRLIKLYKEFSSLFSPLVVSQYLKHGDPPLEASKDKDLSHRENLKCIDKSIYSGQVDDKNRRHGFGVLLAQDKGLYIGFFKVSYQKGPGRYFAANGLVYDGKWNGGMLKSSGTIYYLDGQVYEGCLNCNVPQGVGTLTLPGRWAYEGGFLEGLKHGKGVLVKWLQATTRRNSNFTGDKDRDLDPTASKAGPLSKKLEFDEIIEEKFVGDFARDKLEGRASITFSDGSSYEGEVKKGKMHGKGTRVTKSYTYTGEFVDGLEDGTGEIVYVNGKKYNGFFRSGRPDGKGVETRPDGLIIEGLWKSGQIIDCFNDAYQDPLDAYPAFNKLEIAENFQELHDKVQASRSAKAKTLHDEHHSSSSQEETTEPEAIVLEPYSQPLDESGVLAELETLSEIVISHSLYKKSVELFRTLPRFEYVDNALEHELRGVKNKKLAYYKKKVKFTNEWVPDVRDKGVYKGEKDLKGKFCGRGLLLAKGKIYQGFFVDGLKEGQGREIRPNGSYYEGGWIHDRRNGWGVERSPGKEYVGEWLDDAKHGFGVMAVPDWTYEGPWVADVKEGQGLLVFADGTKFKGELANDAPHGYGCYIEANSKATLGVWQNGHLLQNKIEEEAKGSSLCEASQNFSIPLELSHKSNLTSYPDSSLAPNEYSQIDSNILKDIQD